MSPLENFEHFSITKSPNFQIGVFKVRDFVKAGCCYTVGLKTRRIKELCGCERVNFRTLSLVHCLFKAQHH